MNVFRFSGGFAGFAPTCSADTIVPWMTSRSTPAARIAGASRNVCCGETRTATTTPWSRISLIRNVIRSSRTGSAYIRCSSCVAPSQSRPASDSSTGTGSSYLVQSPSASSTPRPPIRLTSAIVAGDIVASDGKPISGKSNRYASICQASDTASMSRVRRDGTMPT
jgi:hypothetical protein